MASDNVRWRNVREFLDDLPKEHCHVKPDHQFCTVCMRINYLIAQDCPLFHVRPKRRRAPTPAPPEARPEPIKECLSAEDVKCAMEGEDFPIIEFAGPRGTGSHDGEEIFEVKPIDVKPMAAPPPEAVKRPPRREAKERGSDAADTRPATAVADRDPESIVQEIMEELEFPDELDEEEGADDVGGPAVRDAGEAPGGTGGEGDGKKDEGPEEGGGTEENGDPEETEGPPVVRKEAVRKRRPKDG